ncbi:MAG TPA: BamA/TamA family outer membrane protein [Cyclobacteriaceae bacterium]|nr:BamA/TamA family outer membrane protein [Cyclobacteriaceae bacterium]
MRQLKYFSLFSMLLLMAVLSSNALAQSADSSKHKLKRFRLSPLPVIYYSPETRLGFGGLLALNFETNKKPDSVTKASYLQTSYIYTINKQFDYFTTGRIYTPNNNDIINIRFDYAYFPEYFFGYETENPKPNKDLIQYNRVQGEVRYYRKIKNSIYVGLLGKYNNVYALKSDATGSFLNIKPPGYEGYTVYGFAPAFSIDRRDNQVYPRTGFFLETMFVGNTSTTGNYYRFNTFKLDVRKYFPIGWLKNDVVALQGLLNVNSGNVPFKDMADIGGSNTMRGYYTGYYRYKNLYAFQSEYRATIWKRLGFTVWGGFALTAKEWYKPFQYGVKPNAGIGLRIMINTNDKLNVRVDQGFGKQQAGFYLDIAEAY